MNIDIENLVTSTIRTIVPALVGIIIAQAAKVGINFESDAVASILTAVLIGLYYATVRVLATKAPAAEWLLGSPKAPSYAPPASKPSA